MLNLILKVILIVIPIVSGEKDVNIYENEMDMSLTTEVIDHTQRAIDKINNSSIIAQNISDHMEQEFTGKWTTIISENNGTILSRLYHESGYYIRFSLIDFHHTFIVMRVVSHCNLLFLNYSKIFIYS